jgi:hypothetical protein
MALAGDLARTRTVLLNAEDAEKNGEGAGNIYESPRPGAPLALLRDLRVKRLVWIT